MRIRIILFVVALFIIAATEPPFAPAIGGVVWAVLFWPTLTARR